MKRERARPFDWFTFQFRMANGQKYRSSSNTVYSINVYDPLHRGPESMMRDFSHYNWRLVFFSSSPFIILFAAVCLDGCFLFLWKPFQSSWFGRIRQSYFYCCRLFIRFGLVFFLFLFFFFCNASKVLYVSRRALSIVLILRHVNQCVFSIGKNMIHKSRYKL